MAKAFFSQLFFAARTALFGGLVAMILSPAVLAQGIPTNALPQGVLQQLPPGVTAAEAQRFLQQQQQQQNPASASQNTAQPPGQQLYVSSAPAILQTTSALEGLYSRRAGRPLKQFGYDLIGNGGTPWIFNNNGMQVPVGNGGIVSNPQIGAVQDDYILGPGDQLNVTFRGDQNSAFEVMVGRDGTVALPNMTPIPAAGRSFGDFRADVERTVQQTYVRTRVFINVVQLRELSIRVVGEVTNPGTYELNGLSTVLDALNLAGGIKKSGSLRNITVVRGGRTLKIDLYAMLTAGQTPDLTIAQGDRIVVPAIGFTAAVAGDVRRPGIYELPPGTASIAAPALLSLSEGTEITGVYRQTLLRNRPDGKQELVDIPDGTQASLRDGEVLIVRRAVDLSLGSVTLAGDVRLPGEFALSDKKTLHDLLPSMDVLAPEPYLLLGVIDRLDPKTLQRVPVVFSPLHVIAGTENADLMSNDVVRIFTLRGGQALAKRINEMRQKLLQPQSDAGTLNIGENRDSLPGAAMGGISNANSMAGTNAVANGTVGNNTPTSSAGTSSMSANSQAEPPSPAPLPLTAEDLGGYLVEQTDMLTGRLAQFGLDLSGPVRRPGAWLAAPRTNLAELVTAAGGLEADADLSQFEITSTTIDNQSGRATVSRQTLAATVEQFSQLTLKGSEEIIFHRVSSDQEGGDVQIAGEVRYPGTYHIIRGERLSSLIKRAGGYLPSAYTYGSVFTRLSVAKAENDAYAEEANEMESSLEAYSLSGVSTLNSAATGGASPASTMLSPATGSYLQVITDRLRKTQALGRLTINADPALLARRPDLDIVLEPGDRLIVPRKPASVNVVGEVRNPSGIVFNADLTARDYIRAAGGTTRLADESGAFVIYPDGNSAPLSGGFWSIRSTSLAPGSTIVVPRDVTPPLDWADLASRLATIVGQIALTAASISIVSTH